MSGLVNCHACGRPVAVGATCQTCGARGSFAFTGEPETADSRRYRLLMGVGGLLLLALLSVAVVLN